MLKLNKFCLFLFVGIISITFSCTNKTTKEENTDTIESNSETSEQKYNWTDCQNCGMPTNDFPHWQVMLKANSENLAFCAPRCMMIHLADSSNNAANSIEKMDVTDYYTTQKIDGKAAFYVTGSDKTSPMGKDFVPFSTKEEATSFMQEHNGKKIYSFEEITQEVIVLELK
ncbi:putative lipoprotein involved in nitrous oxide reduction [Bernardetia litoralis DSM 6794]|uniref:Putative lipoprotein involved in nitrous oxide reduction n=1 Tax=Bernardetia litoralis (strain ATCC 23117 / DSM 6794 / NBRC 15988 / NCIMB 1366 / Fx l1 / Sio-4) TaxID=880071 RepID=I4AGK9_BERLS|nr:nitrous oxide reductase accessory protein NosL [Bernardetia litoralis]AFM03094.1 putative lipoprotein involved in nitrous oxide reduction [Bernardetia litoralis DSM 6794]